MGSTLSNVEDKAEQHPELSALNNAEKECLHRLYGQLFPAGLGDPPDIEKASTVFSCATVPDFGKAVVQYLQQSGVSSTVDFLVLMAKCSRGRADDTIRFFWEIAALCDATASNQYAIFFQILLEFGNCALDGIGETSQTLQAHLTDKMHRGGSEVSVRNLIEWGHEYAPNMHRLLVTHLNQVCYTGVELLSFTPFCPPVLEVPSGIVTQSGLLPLALYTSSCQGRWRCLYTTARDGISFNRVAHNILGYGVRSHDALCCPCLYSPAVLCSFRAPPA